MTRESVWFTNVAATRSGMALIRGLGLGDDLDPGALRELAVKPIETSIHKTRLPARYPRGTDWSQGSGSRA